MRLIKTSDLAIAAYIPEDETQNVHAAQSFAQDVHRRFYDPSYKRFPSALGMDTKLQFRPGEITVWAGQNGHFKSFVTSQVMTELMLKDQKVMISSLEMRPDKTLERMIRQASGCSRPEPSFVDRYMAFTQDRLWIHDQQGSVKPELMMAVLRYCADQFGCQHLLVDSLMKVVRREDDYNAQKDFVDQLCVFVRDYNVHVHLVAHQKKPSDQSEDKPGSKYDIKGASSISDLAHNVVMVFRNKSKESAKARDDNKCDILLNVVKQRDGDFEGPYPLWRDPESLQFRHDPEANPKEMLDDDCPI